MKNEELKQITTKLPRRVADSLPTGESQGGTSSTAQPSSPLGGVEGAVRCFLGFLLLLIYIYSISFYFPIQQLGAYTGAPFWHFITCHFIHTHLLHLAINMALLALYWSSIRHTDKRITLPVIFVSSVIAAWISAQATPTIGASSIVMAAIGVLTSLLPIRKKIKINATVIVTSIITGLLATHINTLIHVYSFYISFAVSLLLRRFIYAHNR